MSLIDGEFSDRVSFLQNVILSKNYFNQKPKWEQKFEKFSLVQVYRIQNLIVIYVIIQHFISL